MEKPKGEPKQTLDEWLAEADKLLAEMEPQFVVNPVTTEPQVIAGQLLVAQEIDQAIAA